MTDWGILNVVYHSMLAAADGIVFVQPSFLKVAMNEIPGRGTVFVEPLAKTRRADTAPLYCEAGLDYGSERFHALIADLTAA